MEHQTFCKKGLSKIIRKSDFVGILKEDQEIYGETLIQESIISARTRFSSPANPLSSFKLDGNLVFKLKKHSDRIVERKLTYNLYRACNIRTANRSNIIQNLKLFLREGIPYTIYRLDIRKFYESLPQNLILNQINENSNLSPSSRLLIKHLLEHHSHIGGTGTPRGLPLSANISELIMQEFDSKINNNKYTFFYSRYVDDIILISSGTENKKAFLKFIKDTLPEGLKLNPSKLEISSKLTGLTQIKPITTPKKILFSFEYLGYKFNISNPYKNSDSKQRVVDVDIATKKANKYKLRISRAFYDFTKTNDSNLLKDRIRYLTSNFRVFNPHLNQTRLAGIFHNYPEIQLEKKNLKELDHYLRGIVLSKRGRLGQLLIPFLTPNMKRELLHNSFTKGHAEKKFAHFSASRINQIKKCWKY